MTTQIRTANRRRRFPVPALAVAAMLIVVGSTAAQRAVQRDALPKPAASEDGVAVYFSPNGGCADAVRAAVDGDRRTIDVQAFILSNSLFCRPLIAASERGVRVRVIMDAEQADVDFALDERLADAGVAVYRCTMPEDGSMHHKTMVIDGSTVLTGSFNFSRSAEEKNAENLIVLTDKPKLAEAFTADFDARVATLKRVE